MNGALNGAIPENDAVVEIRKTWQSRAKECLIHYYCDRGKTAERSVATLFDTGKKLAGLQREMEGMAEAQGTIRTSLEKLSQSSEGSFAALEKLTGSVGRHDMAIEDLLDSLEEWQSDQKDLMAKVQAALEGEARDSLRVSAGREKTLLEMAVASMVQMDGLLLAAQRAGNEPWIRQISMAMEKLKEFRVKAGLVPLGEKGECFSYELHEAVEAVKPQTAEQEMRIAEVYERGYAYQGQIVQKAKVSVFRRLQEEDRGEVYNERSDWH